jgi:hypothetical protein
MTLAERFGAPIEIDVPRKVGRSKGAHPAHICTRTGLTPPTSAPGLRYTLAGKIDATPDVVYTSLPTYEEPADGADDKTHHL